MTSVIRFPLSVREIPGSRDTEVACHVHRTSLRVGRDDEEFATKVITFMDEHRHCSTTVRLPPEPLSPEPTATS